LLVSCLVGVLIFSSGLPFRAPASDRVERLAALGRVWTTVRYSHPYLAYRDIDWDAPLIAAIPKVIAAQDTGGYAAAVQGMLEALDDPPTRVTGPSPASGPPSPASDPGDGDPRIERLDDGVLVLHLTRTSGLNDVRHVMNRLQPELPRLGQAPGVIVDLRVRGAGSPGTAVRAVLNAIGPSLLSRAVPSASIRTWVHSGYRPQTGGSSGGYFSALQTTMGELIDPAPGVRTKRVAFLISPSSPVAPVAWALQHAGDAVVVAEGGFSEAQVAPTIGISLGEGFTARVRTGELMYGDQAGMRPDLVVPLPAGTGTTDHATEGALAFVRGGPRPAAAGNAPPATQALWRPDKTYPEMTYPPLEYRLLAVYRLWGTINAFFPYKHLLTKDWDAVLPEFISKIEAASDAREYALTIAEMATRMEDTHAGVSRSPELTGFLGEAAPPLVLRYVEDVPVVIGLLDVTAAQTAGVAPGDIVLQVDGEDAAVRAARIGRYLAASNPGAHRNKISRHLLGGPDGSTAAITLRTQQKGITRVTMTRSRAYLQPPAPRPGEAVRILDGNIGYADLVRVTVPQVDQMFETLRRTRAIVFDMRGYPNGTAWTIAPRINTNNARDAAMFLRPMLDGGNGTMKTTFLQPIPPTTRWKYTGPTLMLIDERAISQAEHTGLFFEAANGTTFIGMPTAGANGDVTRLSLPGGLLVGFTGHDVRHADGRQLQKVGLTPHVTAAPTIAGIREGRDEVLEAALRHVEAALERTTRRSRGGGAPLQR
jgi:C-terminal processing protease CtpA/Prc